jgi:two-component system, OmpR family, response regulator
MKQKKKKVLIIDDEVDFCFLLKTYLTKKNYDIILANTLEQGMKLLRSERPDIVFLDNNLPDGLGWEKIEFICSAFPGIEVNLISAYQYILPHTEPKRLKIWEKPLDLHMLDQYL